MEKILQKNIIKDKKQISDYSFDSSFVNDLDRKILSFIDKGIAFQDDEEFNNLSLMEFELQFNTIEPYREYCKKKGAVPGSVKRWKEIPAVPSRAFKEFVLATFPVEKAEHAYFTSGTTEVTKKGKIFRDPAAVKLVNTANGLLTRKYVFPDIDRQKILLMTPSPSLAPGMGMAVGLERVRTEFGTPDSSYLITPKGLDVETLLRSLIEAEKSGKPVALVGSTSGLIYFFNACEKAGITFRMPKGSRICDGGGYLGQFGECSRETYFERCYNNLGIEEHYCINVLGMGEISTNFFDNVLQDFLEGKKRERHKIIPPWTRTEVVDINTFKPLPEGETGLLRHYDLANRSMVFAVQTDNLGIKTGDGFEIVGRWKKRAGRLDAEAIKGEHGGKFLSTLINLLLKRNLKKVGTIYRNLTKEKISVKKVR